MGSRIDRAYAALGEPESVVDLLPRRREAVRLMAIGLKDKEIAQELQYSQAWVSTLRRKPEVRAHLERLQRARDGNALGVKEMLDESTPRALEVLMNVLDPQTDEGVTATLKTKVKVAQDLLDRHDQTAKVSRSQSLNRHEHLHLTADDLSELKKKQRGAKPVRSMK